jgi:hypothetical protein
MSFITELAREKLIRDILLEQLPVYGFLGIQVLQSNQRTQQGVSSQDAVYFYRASLQSLAYTGMTKIATLDPAKVLVTQTRIMISTYYVFALLAPKLPTINVDTAQRAEEDVISAVQNIFCDYYVLLQMAAQGISSLNAESILNEVYLDENDNAEYSPACELRLQYEVSVDKLQNRVSEISDTVVNI